MIVKCSSLCFLFVFPVTTTFSSGKAAEENLVFFLLKESTNIDPQDCTANFTSNKLQKCLFYEDLVSSPRCA